MHVMLDDLRRWTQSGDPTDDLRAAFEEAFRLACAPRELEVIPRLQLKTLQLLETRVRTGGNRKQRRAAASNARKAKRS